MLKIIAARVGEGKTRELRNEIRVALENGKSVAVYTDEKPLTYYPESGSRINYNKISVYVRDSYDSVKEDLNFFSSNNLMPDVVCLDSSRYELAQGHNLRDIYNLVNKSGSMLVYTQQLNI